MGWLIQEVWQALQAPRTWLVEGTVIAGGGAALGRGTYTAGFSQGRDSGFM